MLTPCSACGARIEVSRWAHWNGLLIRCPECNHWHGKHWSARGLLFASVPLNGLSFFFTLEPSRAALATLPFFGMLGLVVSGVVDTWPDWAMLTLVLAFMLGPLLINAILLVRHQMRLNKPVLAWSSETAATPEKGVPVEPR